MSYGSLPVWLDPTAWAGRTYSPPAGQDVGTIQGEIAARLAGYFTGAGLNIPVYVFPDFDQDTWWASTAIAFVLISYHGSRFGRPMSTDAMVQERVVSFDVHVEARQTAWALTGAGSVYALIDAVEAALTGFRPTACRNAYFVEEQFSEQESEGRVWLYDMRLEVPTLKLKTEPTYALANLVKAQIYAAALANAREAPAAGAGPQYGSWDAAPYVDPLSNVDRMTLANGWPVVSAIYTFSARTLTLPGPVPLVVGAIGSANGLTLYQEFADWTCDGATGVVTAVVGGAIGASDTVQIAWAPVDVVTAVSSGGGGPTCPNN
jgi:Gp37 protein